MNIDEDQQGKNTQPFESISPKTENEVHASPSDGSALLVGAPSNDPPSMGSGTRSTSDSVNSSSSREAGSVVDSSITCVYIGDLFSTIRIPKRDLVNLFRTDRIRFPACEAECIEMAQKISTNNKLLARLVKLFALLPSEGPSTDTTLTFVSLIEKVLQCSIDEFRGRTLLADLEEGINRILSLPNRQKCMHLLACYIFVVLHKGDVSYDCVDEVLARAIEMQAKKTKRLAPAETPSLSKLLLREYDINAAAYVYCKLKSDIREYQVEISNLQEAINKYQSELSAIKADVEQKKREIEDAQECIRQKSSDIKMLEAKISEMEQNLFDQKNAFEYDIQMIKARFRGLLRGELMRCVDTAIDAAEINPPRINVVIERLERIRSIIIEEI